MMENCALSTTIDEATEYLGRRGIPKARWESEVLLGHTLGCGRLDLYTGFLSNPGQESLSQFQGLLARRGSGWPLQYLIGEAQFMGLDFIVKPGVFIPRPETEILVEAVLKIVSSVKWQASSGSQNSDRSPHNLPLTIFDLGTGCGNIAISIAKSLACARIFASDISKVALDIARLNARRHGVEERIHFLRGDLFRPFGQRKADLIISNPPYVSFDDLKDLPKEVRHEPRVSLDGGRDGIEILKKIVEQSPNHLKECGYLALEVADKQARGVSEIIQETKQFVETEILEDYNHIDRVIIAKKVTSEQ